MNKVVITISVLALTAALAGACSNSHDAEPPRALDEGTGGNGGRVDDGGRPVDDGGEDADEDGGITDARDELVPIDASRGEDSGDSQDGGDQEDVLPEPDCVFDEDCANQITLGACELPRCKAGTCEKELAPRGTPCNDGVECSSGGLCEEGVCTPGKPDMTNPNCAETVTRNTLWITEVMGRPRSIDGSVDPVDGQWVEITSRALKELDLQGVRLVHFDWAAGEPEPSEPSYVAYLFGNASISSGESLLVGRSPEPTLNGGLRMPFYDGDAFEFRGDRNARLVLVTPAWVDDAELPLGQLPSGPIAEKYIIDTVFIPAGTFSEANQGRSWQASMPLPDPSMPEARVFCHTPETASNAYVEEGALKNYGTPGAANVGCGP